MEKKHDLRVFKTKKAIKEAFLELRKSTPLEKIKVRDICRLAYINTTTFYNHYADALALSESLEDEVLKEAFESIESKDNLFENPMKFLTDAPVHIEAKNETISILFKDREDIKFMKLEKQLRDYYQSENMSDEEDIIMTFIITGVMHTMYILRTEDRYSPEELEKNLAMCIEKLMPIRN